MKFALVNIVVLLILTSCKVEDSVTEPSPDSPFLDKIAEYETAVPEPSGLTLDTSGKYLWTVSDNTNQVYKLDLKGDIVKTLDFIGDDLEGITYDKRTNSLWLAEEELRQLVNIDTNGNEIARFDIKNLEGSGNSGIEGVCLDNEFRFDVLNEKEPALWAKLDTSFSANSVRTIPEVEDLSGITFYMNDSFLIVSDQSQKLICWSPFAETTKEHSLGFEKVEGIAYDERSNTVYVVSDKTAKLYVYKILN